MRRWLLVALALVLTVSACDTTRHETIVDRTHPTVRTYHDGRGLSFAYPARWQLREPGPIAGVGGRLYPVVCLSTVTLASCPSPGARLPAKGVYVAWYAVEVAVAPGLHSSELVAGSCSGTGAQDSASQTWHVVWNAHVNRTVYALACWRGPDLVTTRLQVQAMFSSAEVVADTGLHGAANP